MKLTEHFTLEEFVVSQEAIRRGIDNTPDADTIDHLRALASYLEDLRTMMGQPIVISSGYRCPALNAAVGGVGLSAHQTGYAADILVPGFGLPITVCRAIVSLDQPFDQVIHEYGAWAHISIDPQCRRQQLTICPGGTYQRGLLACG
jgi:hypothetical protein